MSCYAREEKYYGVEEGNNVRLDFITALSIFSVGS